jgi:glutamate-1-semialdehyde aminotransferase
VVTADGQDLVDWTMALGSVSLGYGHPAVTEAVVRAAHDGAIGPLPPTLEVRVAERLVAAYPGAEQARFFKTGAEAVAAAVRLARAATGRTRIVHCGYHGWLDGPTAGSGVPDEIASLWHAVPFDDAAALEAAVRDVRPAAIVLEPVIEHEPSRGWLDAARRLADEHGAALVFDEIKTGFRLARGGAAEACGVAPDLAVLGKAMANGYPLAAVVGKADIMARSRHTWISSTLATEFVSFAAADAVLDVWEATDVAGHIASVGQRMLDEIVDFVSPPLELHGLPSMWFLRFPEPERERAFLLGCAKRGVLLKRGAYNFPSLSHGDAEISMTLEAARAALLEAGR